MYIFIFICIYRLVPLLGTTYNGVGWDVNVHVNLEKQLMLRTHGVGGGIGWDVNVHVNLHMLRARGVGWGGMGGMLTFMWTCRSSSCYPVYTFILMLMMMMMMIMMMMMMTLMKLVNCGTKIRPGIDKFYQPSSGLRSSKRGDKAIYT